MRGIIATGILLVGTCWLYPSEAQTFGGYDCTEDCSGHKAGYDWAERNGISNKDDCSGNSNSFEEGCKAYVEDSDRGSDEDDDGNEIDE
ncbi:hypothetical protein [Brucella anthropi]|uniref:Uncharacterized protein n=1 Tax=Brucella anthropi TaxID=529 RepID=A0A6L3Z1F5_BRUAN|nr:hypothetical protein [Brucella anthropi]KAB2763058.1 hypothetical protein F9L04_21715 [Brucella anthropi]UVV67038.1 hypothetical protein NW321_11245 [Brucella anthropi]